ncbi:metal ABC transporter solute-binding protein, Zn/Mn family [Fictibacillus phosphorivorans]|uniref:metal ABC transporter solute-binding protein, Zn/Mn family n=1 Tax=Fictibacillus phosphorivorans TaxID=1221500 RepID=UPI00203BEF2B|nr:zinc ABC transporter substrate-binding protein [Fictibacillus phosphorivorans]MCM3718589.1 zinc ABC transporter substrate-binding protein [Fictibacillus phosphorivorans]MCM3776212.1 zinc ABC transporter substrate-binding protein [Fictibacillus phosphorivorans]
MKRLGMIGMIFLLIATAACSNKSADKKEGTLNIYTTIYPLEYFTERIGGKHVEVSSIIPPGADAHTYEPSTKKMVEISEGDAFVYNKMESDEFSSSVADTLKGENVPLVDAAKGVEPAHMEDHKEEGTHKHGSQDPHIWLNPVLAQKMADNIFKGLVEVKPQEKEYFKKNHDALIKDLEKLDATFKSKVEEAPKDSFIVSHAAYGYWAERYGLEQIAISGLSPSHEPSQHQIENIIQRAKKEEIRYILFEKNVNNKVAEVINKEVKAETLTLHNLETLTKADRKKNRDYLSIMDENIETLSKALQ